MKLISMPLFFLVMQCVAFAGGMGLNALGVGFIAVIYFCMLVLLVGCLLISYITVHNRWKWPRF